MIRLIKGYSGLVCIDDHVQLHAVVQPHATALGFDVLLFETL